MDEQLIIANARKTAERLRKRKKEFSQEEFLRCRVSTVPHWKRIVVIIVGIGFSALAVLIYLEAEIPIWGILFGIFSLAVLLIGIFGRRKKVETVLNGLDSAVSTNIIDAIF